jgi:hypothetical protein
LLRPRCDHDAVQFEWRNERHGYGLFP